MEITGNDMTARSVTLTDGAPAVCKLTLKTTTTPRLRYILPKIIFNCSHYSKTALVGHQGTTSPIYSSSCL